MITMLIISIVLVAIPVVAAIYYKKELPKSISDLVYYLPKKLQWLWTVWIWLMVFCVAPSLITALEDSVFRFLGFFTIACFLFVGAWPLFDKSHLKWHNTIAIAGGVFSQLCVLVICPWWLLLWLIMLGFVFAAFASFNDSKEIPKVFDGKGIFLSEMICMISLVMCLIFN